MGKCEVCDDEYVFDYYGEVVQCADCCDDLTKYESVKKVIDKLKQENEKLKEQLESANEVIGFIKASHRCICDNEMGAFRCSLCASDEYLTKYKV